MGCWGIGIGPEFGWCHAVGDNLQLDLSLGINAMYLFLPDTSSGSGDELIPFAMGPEANVGLWYRNVLFSLSYSPALVYTDCSEAVYCHRVFFNLGFRF